ncbi:MAG: discoidin domain-containing protein [Candidatus Omnitrophota bacterium]
MRLKRRFAIVFVLSAFVATVSSCGSKKMTADGEQRSEPVEEQRSEYAGEQRPEPVEEQRSEYAGEQRSEPVEGASSSQETPPTRVAGTLNAVKQDAMDLKNVIEQARAEGLVKGQAAEVASTAGEGSDEGLVYLSFTNAEVSSFESTPDWAPKPDPKAPIDGNLETRWSPDLGKDNEWAYFDFGKKKTISKFIIRWEAAYATRYEILSSDDAENWKRIIRNDDGQGEVEEIEISPVTCRYVKIIGLERANPDWSFSMWEFEAYGPKEKNPGDMTLLETFPHRNVPAIDEAFLETVTFADGEVVPSPGALARDEFQRGINYTSWAPEELAQPMSDASLKYISEIGAGHLSLMVVWYQDSVDTPEIYPDEDKTISDEALEHAINVIHKLGMKVLLKPHIDLKDDEMRMYIIPGDTWFKYYKAFIVKYAKLAEKYHVEILCIGTELSNTSTANWRDQWADIIDAVRGVYTGPLTYASNWDEYESVSFWDQMDYVGIDAYFPLSEKKDPSKEELVAAWNAQGDKLEAWLAEKNLTEKGIIFTEIGYDSIDGSNVQPWRVLATLSDQVEDQNEQADCLDALMEALHKRSWFKGFYWWNYFPRPDIGALGYTLRGKIGESVLTDWFERKQ